MKTNRRKWFQWLVGLFGAAPILRSSSAAAAPFSPFPGLLRDKSITTYSWLRDGEPIGPGPVARRTVVKTQGGRKIITYDRCGRVIVVAEYFDQIP